MLVLGREKGQGITIKVPPSDKEQVIELVIVEERKGRQVRIGFAAAREIQIFRNELLGKP